jgi:hypothetical protein
MKTVPGKACDNCNGPMCASCIAFSYIWLGMGSRSRRLDFETVSRRINVSSRTKSSSSRSRNLRSRSRLGLSHLGLAHKTITMVF